MQTITLFTSGSRGDVQPYIALGSGLKKAGYTVRVIGSDDFAGLVRDANLDFYPTGPSMEAMLQSEQWRQTLEGGNFLTILRQMQAEMKQAAQPLAQQLPDLLRGSDLIIAGMAVMGVFAVAEQLAIPVVQAYVVPFTPTQAMPSPVTPQLPAGRLLNRLSFTVMRQMFWQSSRAVDVAAREVLGLPRGSFWGPYRALERQASPVLYGYSPQVLPRPDDWVEHIHVTGYWFLDEPAGWAPPPDLQDFLAAGPPPVYIGFGSMGSRDPAEMGRLALAALEQTGQRGLLAAGWGGLQPADLPPTVHMTGSLPHSWLFPRMAAVVHHGGAGTTAAGLHAGVPSIVIPFMADQPFWARQVARLGVGPAGIPRKKLTVAALTAAIDQAVSDPSMRRAAAELGNRIQAEDGVGNAVERINEWVTRRVAGPEMVRTR